MSDNTEDITRFMSFTNVSFNVAKNYLDNYGDLNTAMEAYYEDQKDLLEERKEKEKYYNNLERQTFNKEKQTSSISPALSSTNNTRPISRNTNKSSNSNSKFMSFSDMLRSNTADNDDDNDTKPRNTFAGGETSGLEITDPNNDRKNTNSLIRDLLERAQKNGEQMEDSNFPNIEGNTDSKPSFIGKGYRLGSLVDKPSEIVEEFSSLKDNNNSNTGMQKVTREITFWKDGFQVGSDGKLYRYDDPANEFFLNELNQGRAPLKLLDVKFGQEVEVNVFKKLDENYKPPKRKLGGFYGKGQRLGSPIPGEPTPTLNIDDTNTNTNTDTDTNNNNNKNENYTKNSKENSTQQTQTDTTIQIRYATGKREVFHCNSTDKVRSLYEHVRTNTDDPNRTFTLNYVFPIKPIENMDQTLSEANLNNSVVVQRWI
ncbi:hypothetical protein RI543_003345 [Arxiozyma heterogenica]|uniref:UBX domain-containing protein 1 n=1 Tax=Arxiozyma heterogenica TaxID=278026 RepID=A0AAN7WJJ8_9SACH|nr:hypothetical protein RI543_003345 [Kazachstania heterogenica]